MRAFFTVVLLLFVLYAKSQTLIKTNLLYLASTTPNVGIESLVSDKWSLGISGGYNPWSFSDNRKIKHWLIKGQAKYWFKTSIKGHFAGVHANAGEFNVGGFDFLSFIFEKNSQNYRYQGYFAGGGLSYGYKWSLGRRWSMEAELGLGLNYLSYDKYNAPSCGALIGNNNKLYFGPAIAGVNLIYVIYK